MAWKNQAFTINSFFSLIQKERNSAMVYANVNDVIRVVVFFFRF